MRKYKIINILSKLGIAFSILKIIGTTGACDLGNINMYQLLYNYIISILIMIVCLIVSFINKYFLKKYLYKINKIKQRRLNHDRFIRRMAKID